MSQLIYSTRIKVRSKMLQEILKEHLEEIKPKHIEISFNEDMIEMSSNCINLKMPSCREMIIQALVDLFSNGSYSKHDYEEDEIEEALKDYDLAKKIYENKYEIFKNIEYIKVLDTECDTDYMYDFDAYSDFMLAKIYKEITIKNDCNIDDVDQEMFEDYIDEMMENSRQSFEYIKEKNKDLYIAML